MKKIYTIFVCICLVVGFVACEKDKDFVLTKLMVQNETITPSYGSATIDCSFKADATISEAFVQYALSSSFAKYDVTKMTEEKGKYVALLLDLQDNATYYIRYAVSNKYSSVVSEEVIEFQTLQCTVPTVVLDSIADVWDNRAKAYLHLAFDGGASVTDMGICWGTQTNPTIEDIHKSTKDTVAVLDMTDLQENTTYYVRAYAVNRVGVSYSEEVSFTTKEQYDGTLYGYAYVDLGLPSGLMWATMNVGASTPEESGNYYAWGETSPKSSYTWLNYKWCEGSSNMLTKYNCDSSKGVVDYKTILDPEDDAATVNWGQGWRIPTKAEFDELIDNCTWTWSSINGVYGYEVKSNTNGNSIFLPSVGYYNDNTFQTYSSRYSSSSLGINTTPYFLNFNASYIQIIFQGNRSDGYAIRPVSGDYAPDVPTVITSNVIEITNTSVSVVCEIIRDGGLPIIECGVSYVEGTTPIELEKKIMAENNSTEYICHITGLKANTSYRVRAYATNDKGTAYGEEMSFTTEEQVSISDPTGTENGYGYVDLGLSVKWASYNIGATKPEEYGDYFAWGETEPKDVYDWSTYKWCNGSYTSLTKYNTSSSCGTVDNKTTLELSDDAAHVNWGGSWRIPTNIEMTELCEKCTWSWTTLNGMDGYKVTSKSNGNSIFLPAAGCRSNGSSLSGAGSIGYCWSSSLDTGPYDAWHVYFYSGSVDRDYSYRYCGFSVRPVWGEYVMEETVPTIITTTVIQITETSAVAGGNVTSDGGASVTERGVVYSTNPTPIITNLSNTIRPCGSGTGSFTYNMTGLQSGTTYYVRAYATNEVGTAYGEEVSFTTKVEMVDNPPSNLVAMPFSVSATKQVTFSPGNLQYTQSTNTWSFAENQWDYIGTANIVDGMKADKIDMFGWSADNTTAPFGVSISTNNDDYIGSFVDWGTNQIGNDVPNTWRTLSLNEWEFLIKYRTNADSLKGVAQINGVNGLILLPDNWTCPEEVTFKSGFHNNYHAEAYGDYQSFPEDVWLLLEAAGAIFLPAAGRCLGLGLNSVQNVQEGGVYWSATEFYSDQAYNILFYSDDVFSGISGRPFALSVRLVKDL